LVSLYLAVIPVSALNFGRKSSRNGTIAGSAKLPIRISPPAPELPPPPLEPPELLPPHAAASPPTDSTAPAPSAPRIT
jgi:hypothetical protein